jgi:hypothetical protein
MKDEQGRVRLGLDETLRTQEGGEVTLPSPGYLLEAVEGLIELADQVGLSRVDKPNGLGAVDRLRQGAMEEGIPHVELVDRPVPGQCQGQNSPDGGRLDHRTEGLVVVDPRALVEAAEHITGFVPLHGPVGVQLQLEDLFPGDHVGTRGSGTRSQVWLARHCWSASAPRTVVGTGGRAEEEVAERIRRSGGRRTPAAWRVTIGWMCRGSQWTTTG